MTKSLEPQEIATLTDDLDSAVPGHDWFLDPGDDRAAIVRKTHREYAPAIIEHFIRPAQRALAAIGPEGAAPMKLIITAETIDLRPV